MFAQRWLGVVLWAGLCCAWIGCYRAETAQRAKNDAVANLPVDATRPANAPKDVTAATAESGSELDELASAVETTSRETAGGTKGEPVPAEFSVELAEADAPHPAAAPSPVPIAAGAPLAAPEREALLKQAMQFNATPARAMFKRTADGRGGERGDEFGLPLDGIRVQNGESNTEAYAAVPENDFRRSKENPLSTFSIDVDTASYANVRRFLQQHGSLPPPGAIRIEEFVNYFPYEYAPPKGDVPFAVHCEAAACPWNPKHQLLRIAIKGKEMKKEKRPASNLVFLIDVSGSMQDSNKLPLVKESLRLLIEQLEGEDRVAMCVYAGSSGLVLPSTTANNKETILHAIDALEAGGSTNGEQGIQLAYSVATQHFLDGGTNRVILCTDGDFNVGITDQSQLVKLIEEKAKSKVFLSVLGFGTGNYKDSTMELLADKGNGNYGYVDTLNEGKKILQEQMLGTLITIAKDVKIQVDFNPAHVSAYRLLGYENRVLANQDFKDDKKDAGEIGPGHCVTAFYELIPPGVEVPAVDVEPSKYTPVAPASPEEAPAAHQDELLTVRLRYKQPEADVSEPLEVPVPAKIQEFAATSADFRFASAVVEFGMLLKNSKYRGEASMRHVLEVAEAAKGADPSGYRAEFCKLAEQARRLRDNSNQ